jgi:hypothetical protein
MGRGSGREKGRETEGEREGGRQGESFKVISIQAGNDFASIMK